MSEIEKGQALLQEFKGSQYVYGPGVLSRVGQVTAGLGRKSAIIRECFPGSDAYVEQIRASLEKAGVQVAAVAQGARPNCPREDLFRIADEISQANPDVIVSFGGGSTIDAAKAAEVLRTLGGDIDDYFGTGLVTRTLKERGASLCPHVSIQTVSSSGAHLTKYSNITDTSTGQKKLIVDEAIVPSNPMFDYTVTYGLPASVTMDGALDGIAHSLEVLYGAVGKPFYEKTREIAAVTIRLVVENLPRAIEDPQNREARDALCLATDLGGYAIMVGGTNGGHLTSFSLVDVLSHGRACAIMNPYYTVFFAPAIEDALRLVGGIYHDAGFGPEGMDSMSGRELGEAVAEAMFELADAIGFPRRLADVAGLTDEHIERALSAAKNPQLAMKLQNMPVPLDAAMIDEYMRPILEGARDGDISVIRSV